MKGAEEDEILNFSQFFFPTRSDLLNAVCAHTTLLPHLCVIQRPPGMRRDKRVKECCENQEWWWRKRGKHFGHLGAQLWQSVCSRRVSRVAAVSALVLQKTFAS